MKMIAKRLAGAVPLMVIVSVIVFGLSELIPGDPALALLGDAATPEQVAAVREQLALDKPVIQRFATWAADAVRGDLGTSLYNSTEVTELVLQRAPVSASLMGLTLIITMLVAIPLGLITGSREGAWLDRLVSTGAAAAVSMPAFWVGALLILFAGGAFGVVPRGGYVPFLQSPWEWFIHLLLPALALSAAGISEVLRQTRAAVIETYGRDYVRSARAAGATRREVLWRHVAKNAMVPVATVMGLQVARLVGLLVIIEQLFGMPGLGALAVDAVFNRDIPIVQGVVLYVALLMLVVNLVVDVSYGYFDPRVRA